MRSRPPYRSFILFTIISSLPAYAAAAEASIARVWPKYRTASSFTRIAEYFGGQERSPELIVRSQAQAREGYYFLVRFDLPEAKPGAMLAVEYIMPGEENPRVNFFTMNLPKGSRAVLAGLTGSDWPAAKVSPTAWRLRLMGANGTEIVQQQSFLWSLPPSTAPAIATVAAQ
jgi:hypothetical protein